MKKIPSLIERLDVAGDIAAGKAILELARAGRSAVIPLLAAAADKERPRIRKWSLEALGAIGDKRALPVLTAALDDEMMNIRLHALRGLGHMRAAAAVGKIEKLVRDPSGGIRINAIHTLIKIGKKPKSSVIKNALADPQWYVQQAAAQAAGVFQLSALRPILKRISEENSRNAVRQAAKDALANLNKSGRRNSRGV